MFRSFRLALATAIATLGCAVSAQAATINVAASTTNITEGQPIVLTFTAAAGQTFPAGASLKAATLDQPTWGLPATQLGTLTLPAGQTQATLSVTYDDAVDNILSTNAMTVQLTSTGSALLDFLPSGFSINVIDNDVAGGSNPSTNPSTPSTDPSTPTTPSTDDTPTTTEYTPTLGSRVRLISGNRLSVPVSFTNTTAGYVIVTRGGKVIGKKRADAALAGTMTFKVKLPAKVIKQIRRKGGKLTIYYLGYGADGNYVETGQRYQF
jgi:hypothetical protein